MNYYYLKKKRLNCDEKIADNKLLDLLLIIRKKLKIKFLFRYIEYLMYLVYDMN
jgi:hypothetical protein